MDRLYVAPRRTNPAWVPSFQGGLVGSGQDGEVAEGPTYPRLAAGGRTLCHWYQIRVNGTRISLAHVEGWEGRSRTRAAGRVDGLGGSGGAGAAAPGVKRNTQSREAQHPVTNSGACRAGPWWVVTARAQPKPPRAGRPLRELENADGCVLPRPGAV